MRSTDKLSLLRLLVAAFVAVVISMGLILIFACLIKWFYWSDVVITPVNIVIKLISIGAGVVIATKESGKRLFNGAIVGLFYTCLSYLIFSILLGSFSLTLGNVWDLLFGVFSGGIMGVMVNILKK